jgi:two-component system KDP operon response regulator KdpE
MNELLARVRAQLRRAPAASRGATSIEVGDFNINLEAHSVTVRGKEVHLTPKEFELLTFFAQHAGKVLTHRALLSAVWGGQNVRQPEYLRVFVGQLRKKIEGEGSPHYIITEPWIGYRFDPGA